MTSPKSPFMDPNFIGPIGMRATISNFIVDTMYTWVISDAHETQLAAERAKNAGRQITLDELLQKGFSYYYR